MQQQKYKTYIQAAAAAAAAAMNTKEAWQMSLPSRCCNGVDAAQQRKRLVHTVALFDNLVETLKL